MSILGYFLSSQILPVLSCPLQCCTFPSGDCQAGCRHSRPLLTLSFTKVLNSWETVPLQPSVCLFSWYLHFLGSLARSGPHCREDTGETCWMVALAPQFLPPPCWDAVWVAGSIFPASSQEGNLAEGGSLDCEQLG